MTSSTTCPAIAFRESRGPAAVPFQLCCVLALIAAAGSEPQPLACAAARSEPRVTLLWPEPDPDLPTIGEPVR